MNKVYNRDKAKEVMYYISYTSEERQKEGSLYYISYTREENSSKTNGSVIAKISLSFWMFLSAASHPIAIAFGCVVAHHSWEYVV